MHTKINKFKKSFRPLALYTNGMQHDVFFTRLRAFVFVYDICWVKDVDGLLCFPRVVNTSLRFPLIKVFSTFSSFFSNCVFLKERMYFCGNYTYKIKVDKYAFALYVFFTAYLSRLMIVYSLAKVLVDLT